MEKEGGLVVRGRVEIDMRQPFRSVKEAISLFGEKVLAGEIYAPKLNERKLKVNHQEKQKSIIISDEAERNENQTETNESSNKKTNEESNLMAFYLNTLKQELEETRKELQLLKTQDHHHHQQEPTSIIDPEIEEIKFVENSTTRLFEVDITEEDQQQEFELEKKRSVKFASPPMLTRMIVNKEDQEQEEDKSNDFQNPSFEIKKIRRKPLIPLFGGLFSKKKGAKKIKSKSYQE